MATAAFPFGGPTSFTNPQPSFQQQSAFTQQPSFNRPQTSILPQFISLMHSIQINGDGHKLSSTLECDPTLITQDGILMNLRRELQADPRRQLSKDFLAADASWGTHELLPFKDAVVLYLEYLRDVDLEGCGRGDVRVVTSVVEELLTPVINKIIFAVRSVNGPTFIRTLKRCLRVLVRMSVYVDKMENRREDNALCTKASNVALSANSACLGEKSTEVGRRIGALGIANLVFKLYKQLQREKMMQSVIGQMQNVKIFAYEILMPKSDRVTFHFYYGIFLLNSGEDYLAYDELSQAYYLCHPKLLWHRRKILTYLIPACLIIGLFPSQTLLRRTEAAGLAEIFMPLCAAIAKGDFSLLRHTLWKYKKTYMELKIYGYLHLRLEFLVWRSFIQTLSKIASRQGNLSLKLLQHTINWQLARIPPPARSVNDHIPWSLLDVQSLVAAQINAQYLKGAIAEQENDAILITRSRGAFPNVFEMVREGGEMKKAEKERARPGAGGVVRMTGARAAGS